jgi:hypothetical protein
MSQKSKQYALQVTHKIIGEFIDNVNSGMLNMAWVKAQFLIEAQAKYHVYTGHDESDALAMAWEDFDMACRGKADPAITAPVFLLWAYLPGRAEKHWMRTLKDALKAAQDATETAALRYYPSDYAAPLRTLDEGFDLPEAVPMLRVPAAQGVRDAKELKAAINKVTDFNPPVFSVIDGGKSEPQDEQQEEELF